MTDVCLFHTDDGGEVRFVNGEPVTSDGLETAAYLSIFGGNERDSGLTDGEPLQWWANFEEPVAMRRQRSETQALLLAIPAVPYNLRRVEDAAARDLGWMVTELGAKVTAEAAMPEPDTIAIAVTITIGETQYTFDFVSSWVGVQ